MFSNRGKGPWTIVLAAVLTAATIQVTGQPVAATAPDRDAIATSTSPSRRGGDLSLTNESGVVRTFTNVRLNRSGRWAVFHSPASFLVPGDLNGESDVFLHDLDNDVITLVSESVSGGAAGADSSFPDVSANGRYVVYHSLADDLVPGDTNGTWDVFLWDRDTGQTTLVSKNLAGVPGDDRSYTGSVSNNGRYVTFVSFADNLTGDPADTVARIFLADLQTGTVELVVEAPEGGFGADSFVPHISGNGRFVAFESRAAIDPGDDNGTWDVYLHELETDTTTWVTADGGRSFGSYQPRMSENGRYVVFESYSDALTDDDDNGVVDVFRYTRTTGEMERVSQSPTSGVPDAGARTASISADGSRVAYQTGSDGEIAADANGFDDTIVRDLETGDVWWVSDPTITAGLSLEAQYPSISGNGERVAFESIDERLTDGDGNRFWDPYVVDLTSGTIASVADPDGPGDTDEAFVWSGLGSATFDDVEANTYYDVGVGFLQANGVTTGVTETEYGPELPLTRAQIVTMLYRFNGRPDVERETPFVDVPDAAYFADAVAWAHAEGIVKGTGPDRFSPMAQVTRAQFATMLHRATGDDDDRERTPFLDIPEGSWFDEPVRWMFAEGITTGVSPDQFDPSGRVTRGQAATFLERFARNADWTPQWTGGWRGR
ncbi:MAG: S-layer homology domain-containing protein [Actinomycetota bacterium]